MLTDQDEGFPQCILYTNCLWTQAKARVRLASKTSLRCLGKRSRNVSSFKFQQRVVRLKSIQSFAVFGGSLRCDADGSRLWDNRRSRSKITLFSFPLNRITKQKEKVKLCIFSPESIFPQWSPYQNKKERHLRRIFSDLFLEQWVNF